MKERIKIIVGSGKDLSLKRFHPWVFSGAIKKMVGDPDEGTLVDVYSNKDEYLGTGHYANGSIAVRIVSFKDEATDIEFWKRKILKAFEYRKQLGLTNNKNTNVYRLVYAEGDGLPGLIIDFYNGTAIIQCHSYGMYLEKDHIVNALKEVYGTNLKAVYDKSEESLPKDLRDRAKNGYLFGEKGETVVTENGHSFKIDWEGGQKTGFFIDQRDNRKLLAEYSAGKNVLNTFCYTGGFSVYAANAGASLVHSVDVSAKAIDLTNENATLNKLKNHESFVADTFDFLKDKDNKYDVIVLDPPAFAKRRDVKHNAVMGYKRLNAEAMKMIKPGGILFTFSCSQVVDRSLFNHTVMSAAIQAGREVRILHHLSQPADHAASIFHPEGEYLKGLVVYVN